MYFTIKINLTVLLICYLITVHSKKIKLKYKKLMEAEEKAKMAALQEDQGEASEGDEFKKRNLVELDDTVAKILTFPVRGQAESLMRAISRYTHALHRYIKKTRDGDQEAINLGKAYISRGTPKSFKIKIDGKTVLSRAGLDKYEFQHYEYCREESIKSWHLLKEILENPQNFTTTAKPILTE
uniref:Uncharacterized protein n=1 Tax=Clastoptera arizonana TaxID=38151 RepID=A0A1B6EGF4_9HEMI